MRSLFFLIIFCITFAGYAQKDLLFTSSDCAYDDNRNLKKPDKIVSESKQFVEVEYNFYGAKETARYNQGTLYTQLYIEGFAIEGEEGYPALPQHLDILFAPEHSVLEVITADYVEYDNYMIALTAYNAGKGNVTKWINEGILNEDGSNIENIPYKETNNYVRKIIRDEKIYQDLYENNK